MYDVCLGHCHRAENDPKYPLAYPSVDAYLCNNFDPVTLVDYFGVNSCGVPESQTKVGQVNAAASQSSTANRQILLFIGLVILILLIVLWNKRGK